MIKDTDKYLSAFSSSSEILHIESLGHEQLENIVAHQNLLFNRRYKNIACKVAGWSYQVHIHVLKHVYLNIIAILIKIVTVDPIKCAGELYILPSPPFDWSVRMTSRVWIFQMETD